MWQTLAPNEEIDREMRLLPYGGKGFSLRDVQRRGWPTAQKGRELSPWKARSLAGEGQRRVVGFVSLAVPARAWR